MTKDNAGGVQVEREVRPSLQAQLNRAVEALEFYAFPLGWVRSEMLIGEFTMEGPSPCECDAGTEANAALAFIQGCDA